jgi:hypothetical protein
MGIRDMARRLAASVEELDAARLQDRFQGLGLAPVADAPLRVPVRLGGEVKRMRIRPRSGIPALEVVVTDGSGEATAVFTGRRALGGLHTGRCVLLEGVAHDDAGHKVLLNPAYTLLP